MCVKNTSKVGLQYVFNVFILIKTVLYLILYITLKIDPKTCTFENLEEVYQKPLATYVRQIGFVNLSFW